MRKFLLSTALLSFSLLATSARATPTTFTFTPDGGGTPLTYTFDVSTPTSVNQTSPFDVALYTVGADTVQLPADDESQWFMTHEGYGHVDILFVTGGYAYLLDGPTLFTGSTSSPHILPGTYVLAGEQAEGWGIGGTLFISGAATPEPSSVMLLGTGLAGTFGMRRRLSSVRARA